MPQLQQQLQRHFAVVSGQDSHDDFKPKYKAEPVDDVTSTIQNDISSHDVFIYMKVCLSCCMAAGVVQFAM